MRFISKIKRYNIVFQTERIEHYATGDSRELRPFIDCQFDLYGSMLPHEMDAANRLFIHHGLPTEVDTVTTINPGYRYSVFDTILCQQKLDFDDETRERMEQFLLNREEHGVDYIVVAAVQLAPPWPNYDLFQPARGSLAQALARKVVEDGHAVEDVLAYERQHLNRQDVLDELEAIGQVSERVVFEEDEGLIEA